MRGRSRRERSNDVDEHGHSDGDESWANFCDELKRAGQVLQREAIAGDDLSLAEGYRHLVRMIRAGFEMTGEFGDTRHPELVPMATRTMLSEGVTSDARYHQAFIDGSASHRISGERGQAPFIEFGVYTGRTGFHDSSKLTGCLTERELDVDADGRFELLLSPNQHAGNWIRTDAATRYLFVREYAHDWSTLRPGDFAIERTDTAGPKAPLELAAIRRALAETARFVQSAPPFWAGISDYWAGFAVNEIVPQQQADSATDITVPSGHRFACGYFRLEPDEALLVNFRPQPAPYWGLHLDNYWYEPLSWADNRSQLNNHSVHSEPDGSVRVVISARAPAAPGNWLDTQGHRQGTIVFRWSRSDEPLPEFTTRLVHADAAAAES
ncbi:MAG: DUF1214 domain-containing protein [Deltaproteobacteria bacterium]|nr:DUF1214 domain-containing protein [Deltaproteobacteria bacterium]MBW2363225.1 DUF1214 domain-containing protein [Deltaproteobacteria bacterium]